MDELGLGIDNIKINEQENPTESYRKSAQQCIQSLVHASQCEDASCHQHISPEVKHVVKHIKGCLRNNTNSRGCPVLKKVGALCFYHAQHCNDNTCVNRLCLLLKHKIHQQQHLHQAQMLRRRMAIMRNCYMGSMAGGVPGATATNGDVDMVSQPSLLAVGLHSGQYVSGKVALGSPQGAMETALKAQEIAQFQAAQSRQPQAVSMPGMPPSMGNPPMVNVQPPARPGGKTAVMASMQTVQRPGWGPDMGAYPLQGVSSNQQPEHVQGQPLAPMRMNMNPMQQQPLPHPGTAPQPHPGAPHPLPGSPQLHPGAPQLSGAPQPHPGAPQPHPQTVPVISGSGGQQAANSKPINCQGLAQLLADLKIRNHPHTEVVNLLKQNPKLVSRVLKMKRSQRIQQLQQQQKQQQQQVAQQQQVQQQQMQSQLAQQTQQVKSLLPSMQGMQSQTVQQQQMRYHMIHQMQEKQQAAQQNQMQQFGQAGQPMGEQPGMQFAQPGFVHGNQHSMHQDQQQQQAQLKQQMAAAAQQPLNPQHMMAQGATPSPQQLMQQVRSPPAPGQGPGVPSLPQTVRSPQPTPSPRQQPIPSPHQLQSPHHIPPNQSPHHSMTQDSSQINSHHVLPHLQTHSSMGAGNSDMGWGQQDSDMVPHLPSNQLEFLELMDQ